MMKNISKEYLTVKLISIVRPKTWFQNVAMTMDLTD